jgi:hypothetical protein
MKNTVTLSIQISARPSDSGYFQVYIYGSNPPVQGGEYPGRPNAQVVIDLIYNQPLIIPILNQIVPYIKFKAHSEMINERFRHPWYGTPVGFLPLLFFPPPHQRPCPRLPLGLKIWRKPCSHDLGQALCESSDMMPLESYIQSVS